MAEKCPGCHKSFRRLTVHFSQSRTCPEALKYRAGAATIGEEDDGEVETIPPAISEEFSSKEVQEEEAPPPPPPPGLTEAEVTKLLKEGITEAISQVVASINTRFEEEHQATQSQFAQVGPSVLKFLQDAAAQEQAKAQAAAPQQLAPQGNGLKELVATLLPLFQSQQGGGMDQFVSALANIGKLTEALGGIITRPWMEGFNFATQTVLHQSRMGIDPGAAAQQLQNNPPNIFQRPTDKSDGK